MNAQFTPGPWIWNPEGDETVVEIPINDEPQQFSVLGHSTVASDEDYANARLISAAPDLYAALDSIAKLAECGLHPDPDHAEADLAAIAAQARAALAKVTP